MGTIAFMLIAAVTSIIVAILYRPLQKHLDDKAADDFAKVMGWDKSGKPSSLDKVPDILLKLLFWAFIGLVLAILVGLAIDVG